MAATAVGGTGEAKAVAVSDDVVKTAKDWADHAGPRNEELDQSLKDWEELSSEYSVRLTGEGCSKLKSF